ncbi:MAG: hypothetical protein RLZZ618_2381 [Pseudomonadota bacterium]|jgi:hypothetical protein
MAAGQADIKMTLCDKALHDPISSLTSLPAATLAACLTLAGLPAAWADDTIATDRPDFVESSDVVGTGRFQIETSFSSERHNADGVKTRTTSTPTLLRMGVSDKLELRVETDGIVRSRSQDATGTQRERGFADASLGVKWHMQDGDDASGKPGVAWLLHLDVDSGSAAFRGPGLRPSLRAVAEWELPQGFSVGVMPGFVVDKNADGKRFVGGIMAVVVGKEWTPAWRSFVELAGQQLASRKNGGSVVTFDTGVAYLVTKSVQLDFAIARGLTADSPDFQWGMGLSVRF